MPKVTYGDRIKKQKDKGNGLNPSPLSYIAMVSSNKVTRYVHFCIKEATGRERLFTKLSEIKERLMSLIISLNRISGGLSVGYLNLLFLSDQRCQVRIPIAFQSSLQGRVVVSEPLASNW